MTRCASTSTWFSASNVGAARLSLEERARGLTEAILGRYDDAELTCAVIRLLNADEVIQFEAMRHAFTHTPEFDQAFNQYVREKGGDKRYTREKGGEEPPESEQESPMEEGSGDN